MRSDESGVNTDVITHMANEDRHALRTCVELPGSSGQRFEWALHYLEIKQKTTYRVESGNVVCLSEGSVCAVRSATLLMDQRTSGTYMAEVGGVVTRQPAF